MGKSTLGLECAMPAPRILFVKLSSLGDVVHHMPAVTEFRAHFPEARIGWAVEEAYAPLVALHPAVSEVFPIALRALRREPFVASRWRGIGLARKALRRERWDRVVDAQGLLKSAWVARMPRANGVSGPGFGSAREGAAALFYSQRIAVPRAMHAVERNRALVAGIFEYQVAGAAQYGLRRTSSAPAWAPTVPYAVLLHAASREAKRWPEAHWIALGRRLAAAGRAIVFPGGTQGERETAARLAAQVPRAIAAPSMDLAVAAALLANAAQVAGVDTGLTHLAVAYERPTVGIYCATAPALTGLHGMHAVNLGAPGEMPSVDAVAAAMGLDRTP
jgi:heptosyltransferase-1